MNRALLGAVLVVAVFSGACAKASHDVYASRDAAVAIDTEVMAYLSMARALHHEANLKEDSDVPGAIAALDRLTSAKKPHPTERVPEVEEVLADTFARVAELHVRQGEIKKADESAKEGLMHAPGPSYFRGHLLEVEGITEEARAAELRDAGQPGEAAKAKAHAIDFLHQAVLVQEKVVSDSLMPGAKSEGGSP
jgi:hypothetical protein